MNKFSRKNEYIKYDTYSEIIVYFKDKQMKCLVDNDDIDLLLDFGKWYVDNTGYVKNSHKSQKIHRLIMNNPENMHIDHINGNILDNRKQNLRIVSVNENRQNQNVLYSYNKSGQIGVQYYINHRNTRFEKHYWRVKIRLNKKCIYNKCYNLSELELAKQHAKYIRAYHMPFSKEARELNIEEIPEWVKNLN